MTNCPCNLPLCAKGCAKELGDSEFDPPTGAAIDTAQAFMLIMREPDCMAASGDGGIAVYFDGQRGATLDIDWDGNVEVRDWYDDKIARCWQLRKEAG